MSKEGELETLLGRMRRDWDERAAKDAERYVYTRDSSADEADFQESGRVNYNQLVRPFLPVFLDGRPAKTCRVVEIGCGVGRMTRWFAEEFLEVHGVDISAEMIEEARARLRDYPNVVLHVGSGMDLRGLPDRHFDLAFSYIVFQHIPSRTVIENYVRETARVLKPGGIFKFQLNGYSCSDAPQREKGTWLGESFSFTEAAKMLTGAGFSPLAAEGAGTQYFVLTARRTREEPAVRSSYIFPGQAWARRQLLEGWDEPAEGGCQPVAPRSRTILALPRGERLRFFVSIYFPPVEPFPTYTLTVTVNDVAAGAATIAGKGDYYFEWPVSHAARSGPHAQVVMEINPPYDRSNSPAIRCLGIFAPRDSGGSSGRPTQIKTS